jgi:hypothetical protein
MTAMVVAHGARCAMPAQADKRPSVDRRYRFRLPGELRPAGQRVLLRAMSDGQRLRLR